MIFVKAEIRVPLVHDAAGWLRAGLKQCGRLRYASGSDDETDFTCCCSAQMLIRSSRNCLKAVCLGPHDHCSVSPSSLFAGATEIGLH